MNTPQQHTSVHHTSRSNTVSRCIMAGLLALIGLLGVMLEKSIAKCCIDVAYRVEARVFFIMGVVSFLMMLCSKNNVKGFVCGLMSLFCMVQVFYCPVQVGSPVCPNSSVFALGEEAPFELRTGVVPRA